MWPVGSTPFRVDELLEAGRALDRAVAAGEPADRGRATAVVTGLATYVNSLPAAQRVSVARQLVATLASQAPFEATVPLKRPAVVGAA